MGARDRHAVMQAVRATCASSAWLDMNEGEEAPHGSSCCLVQIEEHYISAAELGRLTGVQPELILRTELTALQVGGCPAVAQGAEPASSLQPCAAATAPAALRSLCLHRRR